MDDEENENLEEDAQEEPFGQPLDSGTKKDDDEKRDAARRVLKEEAETTPTDKKPQTEASAPPGAPPKSPREEAAPTKPPGGEAIKPKSFSERVRSLARRGKTGGAEGEGVAGGGVGQATKQIASKVTQAIKDGVKKRIAQLIASNPYVLAVIIGLGIILIIILFIVGLSYMGTQSNKKPSTSGGTQIIETRPKEDGSTITRLLKLAGEQTVTGQGIDDALTKIRADLTKIKEDATTKNVSDKDQIVKKVDIAIAALDVLKSNKSLDGAQGFLTKVGAVYDEMEDIVPTYPVDASHPTRMPVTSAISKFNPKSYGESFLHLEEVSNQNVYLKDKAEAGKCDAVNIGVSATDPIYPIFGGTVGKIAPDQTTGGEMVTVKNGDYAILYAHLTKITKTTGDAIAISDILGVANENNIQLQIYYKGVCLVTTHADMIDHAMKTRRHQDWGGYLWDRIVKKFNLKP